MQLPSLTAVAGTISPPAETKSVAETKAIDLNTGISSEAIALQRVTGSPVTDAPPALQINLTKTDGPREPSPVYAKPSIEVTYLRDQSQVGITHVLVARELAATLGNMKDQKSSMSVSSLFNQVAALTRETSSYHNEARSFRVPGDIAAEKFSPDFSARLGKNQESVSLSVRTSEGDTISINVVRRGEGTSLTFSVDVDGELSEAEQKSLDKLTAKLGKVADEFFRTGTAELRGLDDVDSDTIKSFSLSLTVPKADDYVTFSYEYSLDEATQTRKLSGQDTEGYSFSISAHLNSLLEQKNPRAVQVLQQYLDLIRTAGAKHDTDSKSVRFMVDGLRSILMPDADLPTAAGNSTEAILTSFDSGLPDFTANFNSTLFYNRENRTQASALVLKIQQSTQVETIADRVLIQQETSYELHNNHFEKLPGTVAPDLKNGNYLYVREHIRESNTRTLDMKAGQVTDVMVEHEFDRQMTETVYNNFHQIDQREEKEEDRQLRNLMDQLHESTSRYAQQNLIELLQDSKEKLFTF